MSLAANGTWVFLPNCLTSRKNIAGDGFTTFLQSSHMRTMVLVYKNLQSWVIFGESVGKYSIHGAYGSVPFSSWTFRPHMICFLTSQSTLKVWNHSSLSLGMGQNHHTLRFLKMLQKGYCMFSEYLVLRWFESTLLARLDTPSSFLWIPSFFEQFRRTIHENPSQIGLVMACLKIAYPQRWCVDGCWAWPNALNDDVS